MEGRQLIAPLLQPGLNTLETLVLRDQCGMFELGEGGGIVVQVRDGVAERVAQRGAPPRTRWSV